MNTNSNTISKSALWADRINTFQASGLSRKDWCQQTGISQTALGYWLRKIQAKSSESECDSHTVFAKLPSEQEIRFGCNMGISPVTICLPENIRIEVGTDCPARLLAALLQALKGYA